MAATKKDLVEGGTLLLIYSLGIGLPFLLISLTMEKVSSFVKNISPWLRIFHYVAGFFLIIMGILMIASQYRTILGAVTVDLYKTDLYRSFMNHL